MLATDYENIINESRNQLLEYPTLDFRKNYKRIVLSLLKKRSLPNDKFFWPNGLLATSLEWSHRANGSETDIEILKIYFDRWVKKGIVIKNSDYTINGYSLLYLYSITKEEKYLNVIEYLVDYLKTTKKTDENSIPYRISNPDRVLIDSLGMVSPFLSRYGSTFNDTNAIDLAITQLTNFLDFGMDKKSGLPYHGYNTTEGTKLGIIGWGRAIGWQLIGMVDSLEYIPKTHESFDTLKSELQQIADTVLSYQKVDGNFSWQITLEEGYSDTSATSMIMYAIKRGIMLKLLPESYLEKVELAKDALLKEVKEGKIFNCSAECRGISMYPQIYGNYPWAQGPTTSLLELSRL